VAIERSDHALMSLGGGEEEKSHVKEKSKGKKRTMLERASQGMPPKAAVLGREEGSDPHADSEKKQESTTAAG